MYFDQFTRRLYDLLKACHIGREYENHSRLCEEIETALGDYERTEILKEPLPDFAIGVNLTRSVCVGAQLFTRNGARTGNAFVMQHKKRHMHNEMYSVCLTESGNRMNLTIGEVHELFTIGPYLCDPKEVETKYGGRQLQKGQ